MSFTDLISQTPKEVYFLILGAIALGAISGLVNRFLSNLTRQRKKSKKPTQKGHEKQLKKLDKVYGTYSIAKVDKMNGQEFELFVEKLFRVLEKDKILKTEFTPATGDQGCDLIIHYRDGARLGIQCKRYASKVDNKAVQNIVTAKAIYGLTLMMVFTNNHYQPSAKEAAR
ncbi:restriction endonuclease, partial [Desulfosporosinus sp. OT]|uniref:restriction endonuclease n=1 Tax=Desulfosporosinus sp. OT TaxID=913865 RepID=UPI000223A8BA